MKKLAFLLALSLCTLAAWAYDFSAVAPTGQTLYYTITSPSTVSVTHPATSTSIPWSGYTQPTGSLTIPSSVTDGGTTYSVTSIGDYAFSVCSGLTSITIPNSVTAIGDYAFAKCISLTSVTIPNSVSVIGDNAFDDCYSLTSVTIPNSVTVIGDYAFYCCSGLTSLTIPNSVTSIGESAFKECSSLTSVTIPNSVTAIGDYAFSSCSSLTSVTIPNSVTTIGDHAFIFCLGLTSLVVETGNTAYDSRDNCNAIIETATNTLIAGTKNTVIPNTVTTIGNSAFCFSGLTSLTIPNSVTAIGDYAFYSCYGLTSLTIPNSVTAIGDGAFYSCYGLTSLVVETGNTVYDSRDNCNAIIETATNTLITGTKNTIIPNSVTSIGDYAFSSCSGLTSITIPNSVTAIGDYAFYSCYGLTSLTIPNSVTAIGDYAFSRCHGLTTLTIPNSVTVIGDRAFSYCSNLKTVYNLSNLNITKGSEDNGYVAYYAERVLNRTTGDITNYGSGENAIYQISADYAVVDVEDDNGYHIPAATIPTNFIYADGGSWKAKEVVLADCQDAFEAPVDFVAERATYSREFVNGNRSTLYLPFSAAVPEGFEVYDFANFDNSTLTFSNHTGDIAAYTPYLVGYDLSKDGEGTLCTISQTNAFFPASTPANYHPVTRNNMTFSGVIERTQMYSSNNYGYTNGSFVHSNGEAHVNPFRSFFTYDAPVGAPAPAPVLNIEFGDPVSIYDVEPAAQQYDGRYGNDVFDMMGRIVRKNADNLNGLPRGIYIWKGKKVFAN